MDDHRLAGFARKQGGVVTTAQLLVCGLTRSGIRHRVVTSRLFPVRRSAYTLTPHAPGPRYDGVRRWAAVLATDPERAALSHWSAAELHRMTQARPPRIHVAVPGSGGRSAAGLVLHGPRELPASDVMLVDGLRVTTPARTVLDVAADADDETVRRLIREGEFLGLLAAGAMQRAVASHPRHPGAARIRRVDPVTAEAALGQTPLEDELEALIRTLPVPSPEPQVVVRGVSGATYRLDFGWRPTRFGAEADGRSAHERASSLESDRFRDNDLAAVGWLVLRFTRLQLTRGGTDAGRQIIGTALRRGWTPDSSSGSAPK